MAKAIRLSILAPLALAWLCGSAPAQVTNSTKNPKQVAILHWYPANLTTNFQVVSFPSCLAFDGANIWVWGTTSVMPRGGLIKSANSAETRVSTGCRPGDEHPCNWHRTDGLTAGSLGSGPSQGLP